MVIFNNTSADFVLISADVLLKMSTILKELRIAQLRSKNIRSLAWMGLNFYDYHDSSQKKGVRKHLLHSVPTT